MRTRSVDPVLLAQRHYLTWESVKAFPLRLRMAVRSKSFSARTDSDGQMRQHRGGGEKDPSGKQENSQKGGSAQGEP
jgi:hypothetical protein